MFTTKPLALQHKNDDNNANHYCIYFDYIVLLYSEKHAYPSNESVDSATICVSKLILCTTTCFRTEVMAQHS